MKFLTKTFTSTALTLSVATALTVGAPSLFASSGSGFIEGSSESTSALIEDPGFEAQIHRINTGVNLVRLNNTILNDLPISEDSEWVDLVVGETNRATVMAMDEVKNDAYYSTVLLTNVILGRLALSMSPLDIRAYWEARAIYKNSSLVDASGNPIYPTHFHIPDMNQFPNIFNTKTFIQFKVSDDVAIIDVEAKGGELFENAELAALALVPDSLHEDIESAYKELKESDNELLDAEDAKAEVEKWLDDEANEVSDERADREAELADVEANIDALKEKIDEKEELLATLIDSSVDAIANDFDPSKVKLAQKLEKLYDTVDNNAIGAASMFTSATLGLYRGRGMIEKELQAIVAAQALTTLVGNQKEFLAERLKNATMGTLYAVPDIAIGSYYAARQSARIGKFQDIVEAVLEGAEALKEANEAEKE